MEFTNNDYYSSLDQCQKELEYYLSIGINTIDSVLDNPIYPNNEELYNRFLESGQFDTMSFILYLIRLNDYEIEYIDDIETVVKRQYY